MLISFYHHDGQITFLRNARRVINKASLTLNCLSCFLVADKIIVKSKLFSVDFLLMWSMKQNNGFLRNTLLLIDRIHDLELCLALQVK